MRTFLGIFAAVSLAFGMGPSPGQMREAAIRAVALLQNSQRNWYSSQGCRSCHHQFQPALAFRSAREHGIPLDETIARADAIRSFNYADLDRAVQYGYVIEPAMSDAYSLVAADASGVRPNLVTAVYARLIALRQSPLGDWPSFHRRPPASYSSFTQTALGLRAIQLYSHPSQQADAQARMARARRWLLSKQPRDTEERTYQLLGLGWAGADRATLQRLARALAATQQPDGGWNSLDGRMSDAYSTAQALVVLHDIGGLSLSNPAWRRGIDFLLKTEAADGSWHVASRIHPPAPVSPPYFETGYPYGHDQFISAAAASWAVMAFARALGPARQVTVPPLKEAKPSVEPWMETVLFGTAAELKNLLDGGFDPNSATKSGTTALMMAAPDVEKVKLLLDRGADINVRAKTGYSALMVAAQDPQANKAIRLLPDRGAEVRVPPGQSKPLFNAYPLFLAAYAGNAEILARLRDAGDRLDDSMVVNGVAPTTPLIGAVEFANAPVVRALLDLGAPVDQGERGGVTPLHRAVLGNLVEIARLLIQRGADVNRVDTFGMTPLLYAASIDFGDSAMIDLLLKSGARPDARTKEGLTALDLARKYNHTHLFARLEANRTEASLVGR